MLRGASFTMGRQKHFHAAAQLGLVGAGLVEKSRPPPGGVLLDGLQKDRFYLVWVGVHRVSLSMPVIDTCENGAESVSGKSRNQGGEGSSPSRACSQARA